MVNHVPLNTSLECVLLQRGFFVHFGLQNLGVKFGCQRFFYCFFDSVLSDY